MTVRTEYAHKQIELKTKNIPTVIITKKTVSET